MPILSRAPARVNGPRHVPRPFGDGLLDDPDGPPCPPPATDGWDALADLARGLIDEWHDLDAADAGGILECGRRLDDVLAEIDRTDPALADELRAERDDPRPGDPADWPAWTDNHTWANGPAEMTFAAWLATQARQYRTLDLDAADAVAAHLDDVAAGVDAVSTPGNSIDPMTALDRLAALERDHTADSDD
jgi:hypothetical protein